MMAHLAIDSQVSEASNAQAVPTQKSIKKQQFKAK